MATVGRVAKNDCAWMVRVVEVLLGVDCLSQDLKSDGLTSGEVEFVCAVREMASATTEVANPRASAFV